MGSVINSIFTFKGIRLTGIRLTGIRLTGIRLTGVHLTGVHLTGAYLICLCFSIPALTAMDYFNYCKYSSVKLETVSRYSQPKSNGSCPLPEIYSKSTGKKLSALTSSDYQLSLIIRSVADNNINMLKYVLRQPGISKVIEILFRNYSDEDKGEYLYEICPEIDDKRPTFLKLLSNFFKLISILKELRPETLKEVYIDKKNGSILMEKNENSISISRHVVSEGYYDLVERILTYNAIPRSEKNLLHFAVVNARPRVVSLLLAHPPIAKTYDKNTRDTLLRLVDKKIKNLTKICKTKKSLKPKLKKFKTIKNLLTSATDSNDTHTKLLE